MNAQQEFAHRVFYRTRQVGDVEVFYREAGRDDAPVILLLHGFPTSSHMFRDLIPLLSNRYRLIAPDLPRFGQTKAPPRGQFDYTFDNLAHVILGFTDALELKRYAISRPARLHTSATFPMRKSICSTPGTSRQKRTEARSPPTSTRF